MDKAMDDSSLDESVALTEEVLEFPAEKSTEHESTSSEDQVAVIALEKTEVDTYLDLQKSEDDETKRQQEEETKQEVFAVEPRCRLMWWMKEANQIYKFWMMLLRLFM